MMMRLDGMDEEDDDDRFFESMERMSTAVPLDLGPFGREEEDDEFADSRMSFASSVGGPSQYRLSSAVVEDIAADPLEDYNVWMMDPGSIKERRMRLLQGMGLFGNKELLRVTSIEIPKGATPTSPEAGKPLSATNSPMQSGTPSKTKQLSTLPSSVSNPPPVIISRSRSDVAIGMDVDREHRRKELLGTSPPLSLIRRIPSAPSSLERGHNERFTLVSGGSAALSANGGQRDGKQLLPSPSEEESFCKIKNLDTGKEFLVNEDGTWNCVEDAGQQLTMEEFERCIGYSPIVKELMRRENVRISRENSSASKLDYTLSAKSLRSATTKKKSGWLKNIKGVATSVSGIIGEKDRENSLSSSSSMNRSRQTSKWMKVRPHGKNCKEISGLYMSQEIPAHQGSIWCIKFSLDTRYLASAGEDRVIHVWQVLECEAVISSPEEPNFGPSRSISNGSPERPPLADHSPSKRRGKLTSSTRKSAIPDYVVIPDTVFSLSDQPVCTFEGHLDDVLDLSWSKSQLLLSSSMDKTVRLWDMESKACLKLFAHNDYVTCIQFNPVDDRYFISGSLDAKVRIWSIPDRQVVDWSDLHEMVTAACYTPDGKGAFVGSHKGSCRLYDTSECKLHQSGQIDIQTKKKKSHAKKITGFQFSPTNASEVLISSADSQIRIFNGVDLVHKFRGLRNTSSQIAASFTADGKYIVSASEDSQVYVWKRDEQKNAGNCGGGGKEGDGGKESSGGKNKGYATSRAHEHFQCREVSVAIPWPGGKYELPPVPVLSKRHHSRKQSSVQPSLLDDNLVSSKSLLPPLPRKNCSEQNSVTQEEDHSHGKPPRPESGIAESPSLASTSRSRSIGSASISAAAHSSSSLSSSSCPDANSSSTNLQVPTAWGLALVTAGLGGEIKVYQNFGLPIRLQNQSLLRL
ncbi:hypothetical protein H6P81_002204 [Aristolochia fimbriata]|uniref:WD repeat-containing protein 44 n=1 Tax=Aristolochia fimbriata TaxID=158543 RepID=A0AAV7FCZ7_ARIFI|nr:hypothetical protein H6P81_002204 [Aristolochia fimbriata]